MKKYFFLISYLIVKNFDKNLLVNTILISSAFYLFFITVKDFFTKKFKNISQNIAHFGFSLLILSILFNNLLSSEVITNLKIGESYENSKIKCGSLLISEMTIGGKPETKVSAQRRGIVSLLHRPQHEHL